LAIFKDKTYSPEDNKAVGLAMIAFSPVMRNHQLDAYNLKSNYRKLKYLFTCGQLVAKKTKT